MELLTLRDLETRAEEHERRNAQSTNILNGEQGSSVVLPDSEREFAEPSKDSRPLVFAAIPFTDKFDDVFLLGIRAAAEEVGATVVRADEGLTSTEIIQDIKDRIAECDLLIADTTEINANVFYELGFADGNGTEVLLIAQADTDLPFDVRGRRHVMYKNILDLRDKLAKPMRSLLAQAIETHSGLD